MRIALALLLNAGLLLALVRWLRRQRRVPEIGRWIGPLMGVKLAAAGLSVVLLSADATLFQYWSQALTEQLWHVPGAWLRTFVGEEFHYAGEQLVFHGYSNTFFLLKLLSVLNLATLGSALLNSVYLSLFNFVGCWQVVQTLARTFPVTPKGAAAVAFLGWPTVVYWTAGLTKESLLVGCLAWFTALVVGWLYGGARLRPWSAIMGLLLLVVGFKMRYFFAVLLFTGLFSLAVIRLVQRLGGARRRWMQVAVLALVLAGSSVVLHQVGAVFRFNKFSSQLLRNYYDLLNVSRGRPHIEYEHLAPTAESIAYNAPKAVGSTLFRPWPWEGRSWSYVGAGVENTLLLALVLLALIASVRRGVGGRLPFALVLVLGLYCLELAVLLGLSTPNLGTLNRYRTAMLPFLLLLLFQNNYAARLLRRVGL